MNENITKKVMFSAIQPTGTPTLGNYLGALKNWKDLQDEFNCIYAVADLHALTIRQDPPVFRKNILSAYALLLAIGLDPKKSIIFIQSNVPEHSQLAWLLDCFTQFGELSRMTQFKDKSAKHADNINAGLFTYPSLMAADILLYNADTVPVGEDQRQHLEITRTIAERFNMTYSPTFVVPEAYIPKKCGRVMSLQDPLKKMSKSDENVNSYVTILDKPDDIIRKFKRAVTDSDSCVKYGEGKSGINNLMDIYSAVTGKAINEIEKEFDGKGYGDFKLAVGESVVNMLDPIRLEYERLMADKPYIESCYREGALKAEAIARKTLSKVMRKIGYIS
jgi:tryptophanyl-tRNA synthetase